MRQRIVAMACVTLAALWGTVALVEPQAAQKKKLTLERLYQYPRLEGTAPVRATWSEDSAKIALLWNDQGLRFLDLWVYEVESGTLTRLTNLDEPYDDWTTPPHYPDKKLQSHWPPEAGLRDFEWAKDSQQLAFSFRGELYWVRSDGSQRVRLTKTKEAEVRPRFSPDSQKLAYVSHQDLWVLDLTTGQKVQLTSGGSDDILNGAPPFPESTARLFEWSPDGKSIAFQQIDRTGERTRLIPNYSGTEVTMRKQRRTFAQDETPTIRLGVVSADGGPVVWLTPSVRQYYYDWSWSPDGTRIAINRVEENWKRRHLEIVDVAGAVKEAEKANQASKRKETNAVRDAQEATEKKPDWVKTIYRESDEKWICTLCDFVEWSPDGRELLFSSERDGWNHLYLLRVERGTASAEPAVPRQLTSGHWEVETRRSPLEMRPRFSPDGQRIYFTANQEEPSVRDLYVITIRGLPYAGGAREPRRLTTWSGYNAARVAPDESRIALLYSSFRQPWDLYVRKGVEAASGKPDTPEQTWQRVTHSPLAEFDDYNWPEPRLVEFPSRDGKTVRALLFPPTELGVEIRKTIRLPGPGEKRPRKPAPPQVQKVPVINFVHGAGYAQAVLNRWGGYSTDRFHFNQFLSQNGYAVIDVDYRGSSGYGRAWRTDVYRHLGGKDLEDELAAMDYLKTLAWVDTTRAGIWGVSYGGFMTLMALFQAPEVFQAGVAWAAVTDWENYHRHYTQQRLRTPSEEPEAYRRSSPIHHVAGLQNHLLVVHGMVDDNVHFQDAVQLIDALVAAGKEFDTMIYPQEDHGWVRPSTWVHSFRKTFEYFERYLKKKTSGAE